MTNYNIFENIFWAVADELSITSWWELFDSDNFDMVETRIAKTFNVTDVTEIEGFLDWYNEMAEDL